MRNLAVTGMVCQEFFSTPKKAAAVYIERCSTQIHFSSRPVAGLFIDQVRSRHLTAFLVTHAGFCAIAAHGFWHGPPLLSYQLRCRREQELQIDTGLLASPQQTVVEWPRHP